MSNMKEMIVLANEAHSGVDDGRYVQLCNVLREMLSKSHREQLAQLVMRGPVWDGDVISKSTRGDLLQLRMASRALYKGAEGHTVATYFGARVFTNDVRITWRREDKLLWLPFEDLTVEELQARYEIEESHADDVMKRAATTLAELRARIDRQQTGAP